MASFQTKIGWKWPRMRENKNYRSVPFRSNAICITKLKKNSKKIQKIKKYRYGFLRRQNRVEKVENERK